LAEELKKSSFTEYVKIEPGKRLAKEWPKERFIFLTGDSMYYIKINIGSA